MRELIGCTSLVLVSMAVGIVIRSNLFVGWFKEYVSKRCAGGLKRAAQRKLGRILENVSNLVVQCDEVLFGGSSTLGRLASEPLDGIFGFPGGYLFLLAIRGAGVPFVMAVPAVGQAFNESGSVAL